MSWLESIAPTIATAVAGPLGGLAYEAVAKVLGVSQDDAKKMLDDGKMTADQIAQVKIAEIELKKTEEQLGLNFESLAVDDRKSARQMQISTNSVVPPLLSILVVTAWALIQYFLLTHIVASEMRELVARVLGTLDSALMLVLSFYFGSSSGSRQKDEMLWKSSPTDAK